MNLDGMVWEPDRLRWRGLTFLIETAKRAVAGADGLVLYKGRGLIEQYAAFWAGHPGFVADQVLELGLWKGGSLAFWAEALQPTRLVGVDLRPASGSPAFEAYLAARPIQLRVTWGVDQADGARLRGIVAEHCAGALDLVIDDASHLYAPTRASFEAVFPLLRPGGWYLVEDWAWHHWPACHGDAYFAGQVPLTRLVTEFVEAVGSGGSSGIVERVTVHQGFVAVRRGPAPGSEPVNLETLITRNPSRRPPRRSRLRALATAAGLMRR